MGRSSCKMAIPIALVTVTTLAAMILTQASDPELTTDYYVNSTTDKTTVTSDYFTSKVFRGGITIPEGATVFTKRITSEPDSLPSLTGLGVSVAMIKYLPGGTNPHHTHPRGTEVLYVMEGKLTVGLVDTTNKLFTQVLSVGDVFVFPKGLVHYQINLGSKPVVAYISFSSSNPGTVSLPATLFGSGIPDKVHKVAFKVDGHVVDKLQEPFNM